MITQRFPVQILLPVHNEGESIEATLREIYDELAPSVAVEFIVTEDGSTDNTEEVLERLRLSFPMKLIMSPKRKGYSRAVVDGMNVSEAPYLLCLDSDGQCDPADFQRLWELRNRADVVIGWRVNRADNALRRFLSRTFYQVYQLFYHVPVHDPSCPFVLAPHSVIAAIAPEMGEMQQGFWWEFVARVHRSGYSILEVPVNHRVRAAGETQVYRFQKMPGIGYRHFAALFRIWRQTRKPALVRAPSKS